MGESISVSARDGYALGCELFTPPGEVAGAVLIAPAMGVPRRLYAGFATHLAAGGLAALVLDYRGMGSSRAGSLRGFGATLHDWGELDLAAGLAELGRRFPGQPRLWFGHSVGGQLFGLLSEAPVAGVLLVASQSGYWRLWPGLGRAVMFSVWHALIPAVAGTLGYLPMKAMGQGEDLPAGVALEWARWGRNPDYVWSYARERGGLSFTSYAGPMRFYSIADDHYAPRPTIEALQRLYTGARSELREVRPEQVGAKSIGHFGFFKSSFRDTLWAEARAWLLEQAQASSVAMRSNGS